MRVLLAGASGLIGRASTAHLVARGHTVVALSRRPEARSGAQGVLPAAWDGASPPPVDGPIDAVVHLAGESVDRRWTPKARKAMRESRVGVARHLVEWIRRRPEEERPQCYVAASGAGYYGLAPQGTCTEATPPGDDFLALLCRDWEAAGLEAEGLGVRVTALRFGVVLHPAGGALRRLLPPFRMGLGGPLGSGRQPFAWVHLDDAAEAVAWAVETPAARGACNVVAPQGIDMAGFARTLAASLRRPAVLRVPPLAVRAVVGKGAAEVLLGGQEASADRILRLGFRFSHPGLAEALEDLLVRR